MKLIPLTQGQFAKVSDRVYEEINSSKWCAWWNKCTKSFYAVRKGRGPDESTTVLMHRQILGLKRGDQRKGDHENHDTLDNTDENLRMANTSKNSMNGVKRSTNTSGFKGVSYDKKRGVYVAEITVNYKKKYLGSRGTAKAAHEDLYVPAALELHGEFARMA